jgi:hypothetical protein
VAWASSRRASKRALSIPAAVRATAVSRSSAS